MFSETDFAVGRRRASFGNSFVIVEISLDDDFVLDNLGVPIDLKLPVATTIRFTLWWSTNLSPTV